MLSSSDPGPRPACPVGRARAVAVACLSLLAGCDSRSRSATCVAESPPDQGGLESCSAVLLPQLDRRGGSPDYLVCTSASAINASGTITGETCDGQGFMWSSAVPAGSLVRRSFPVPADVVSPTGVDSAGDIVGGFLPAASFVSEAFILSGGELTRLPQLEEEFPAFAHGTNGDGTVVGSSQTASGANSPSVAVYWQDGQIHRIGGVDDLGGNAGGATAVSGSDIIVGYSNTAEVPAIQPFRWRRPDAFEILPTFAEGDVGTPQDVNEAGVTVGRAGGPLPGLLNAAVYWDVDGSIHQLPGLDDTPEMNALAINNRGVIVGYEMSPELISSGARLWIDGEVHDLQDLVPLPEEYRLTSAVDINDNDEVVAIASVEDGGPVRHVTFLLRPDL
jgi:hypothetical protein